MKKLYTNYLDTFKGLSKEVWWLALITLINRAGTMVIPFLSLYLIKDLNFTMSDVGWVMTSFGLGSVVGSWLGGKLTDKIGYYKVMVRSLLTTGFLFIGLQYLNTFASFCAGIFVLMVVADMFRPAMFVALSSYSKPENKTRSVTLVRLAINLGFSAGPAIGGIIITTMSYGGLFWIDGITCILATFLLMNVLHPKKTTVIEKTVIKNPISAFSDKAFMLFLVSMTLFGIVFLQYFSTIPLYYKDVHFLSELEIGLILGMNGFVIFVLEMPLVKWLEGGKHSQLKLMFVGGVLTAISFAVLNLTPWIGIIIVGMLFVTIGEMITFPFSNTFAMKRAEKGKQGQFMAFYTISFSIAHIFGHNVGMNLIDKYGYAFTWNVVSLLMVLGCVFMLLALRVVNKEKAS